LAKIVFKDIKLAFFTGLFFSLSASAYQGTAWTAADIGTHGSTIFALISSIFLFKYLNTKKPAMSKLSGNQSPSQLI